MNNYFNSYFNFLQRNKAYTIIDVLGLAASMMFLILIGAYTWQETHIDRQHTKADRTYVLGLNMDGEKLLGSHWRVQHILRDQFPEIETSTAVFRNHRWLVYNDENIETDVLFVDSTFYDVFDFELIQGDRKHVFDSPYSCVVTEEFARRVFGDEDPIGKTIIFNRNDDPLIVAGVMEPMKNTALMTNDYQPIDMLIHFSKMKYVNYSQVAEEMNNAVGTDIFLVTKEKIDVEQKAKEYEAALKDKFWILDLPENNVRLLVEPFKDIYFSELESSKENFNQGNGKMVRLLFIVGFAILLFALMNYVNLTVALSSKRAKEMATRQLLGESRLCIIFRLVFECTMLCVASFAIGFGFAYLLQDYASELLEKPVSILACINPTTIACVLGFILFAGFSAGIAPAVLISSVKPIDIVKGAFKRKTNMVFSKVFIVIQNVVTIVMIACALTMSLQVNHLVHAPLGYETDGLLTMRLVSGDTIKDQTFEREVKKLPCVKNASWCWGAPLGRGNNNTMTYEGRTISFQTFCGDSCYFETVGLKKKIDKGIKDTQLFYLNDMALTQLGITADAPDFYWFETRNTLAGVVEDFHIGTILSEQRPVRIEIGRPLIDFWPWELLVKVQGDMMDAQRQLSEVFETVYQIDGEYFYNLSSILSNEIEAKFRSERNLSIIIGLFALIAIIISMLGLVAMSSFYVTQRANEIAVRKVMGGSSEEVLGRLLRSFLGYVAVAFVLAIPFIYLIMNDWLSQYSYRITIHWWIYASAGTFCLLVAFASVIIQSYRAANANPVRALYQN